MPTATLPTPEQVAEMMAYSDDNLVPNLIACLTICATAATIFIGLCLWSRWIVRGRFSLDVSDCLAVTAWTRLDIVWLLLAAENLYVTTLALLKFSILSLYRNIFTSSRTFRRVTWVVTALVTEWLLQVVLSSNLQYIPIAASWDLNVHGNCINYGVEALVAYIINIFTDIMILSMPIPLFLKLITSKAQKRRLAISFAAGGRDHRTVSFHRRRRDHGRVSRYVIATYRPLYRGIFHGLTAAGYGNPEHVSG
ncbi:hypothetical protein F4810DRAFT_707927 [Camillea tinctor]|nr:hypothetical protein F4810DRAFT_707927 [Camillea tinctor]